MRKCAICHSDAATWSMQPFGPDDAPTFTRPGSHYRGFPALPACDACKGKVQDNEQVVFTYRKQPYIISNQNVIARPW